MPSTVHDRPAPDAEAFLSVAEVAQLLRLSEKTVRRWIESGRLPAIRTSPPRGRIRVAQEALQEFLAECRVVAHDEDESAAVEQGGCR